MEMREKIARAIAVEIDRQSRIGTWVAKDLFVPTKEPLSVRAIADAVLAAMREPDEAMIEAGFKARERGMNMAQSAAATWQAMLDAARTPVTR